MKKAQQRPESLHNLTGQTRYIDDAPVPASTLHAVPVGSRSARGRNLKIDPKAALAVDPSVRVLVASDVPYGRVVEVMGAAHAAGLQRIGFVTQPTDGAVQGTQK